MCAGVSGAHMIKATCHNYLASWRWMSCTATIEWGVDTWNWLHHAHMRKPARPTFPNCMWWILAWEQNYYTTVNLNSEGKQQPWHFYNRQATGQLLSTTCHILGKLLRYYFYHTDEATTFIKQSKWQSVLNLHSAKWTVKHPAAQDVLLIADHWNPVSDPGSFW